jgi:hypothetical protein
MNDPAQSRGFLYIDAGAIQLKPDSITICQEAPAAETGTQSGHGPPQGCSCPAFVEFRPEKGHQLVSGGLVRFCDQIARQSHGLPGINFDRNTTDQYSGGPEEQELKGWSGRNQSGTISLTRRNAYGTVAQ